MTIRPLAASALSAGALRRLAVVVPLLLLLWLAVAWALAGGGP